MKVMLAILVSLILLGLVCAVWMLIWSIFEETKLGQIIVEKIEKTITAVRCDFADCIYNVGGKCSKKEIYLDNRVDDIFVGCPDAEWEDGEKGNV